MAVAKQQWMACPGLVSPTVAGGGRLRKVDKEIGKGLQRLLRCHWMEQSREDAEDCGGSVREAKVI